MSEPPPPTKPRHRNWRRWAVIAGMLFGVLLILCFTLPQKIGVGNKADAQSGCRLLVTASNAFAKSESNPTHEPPKALTELHRPPWGGGTFLPDGEYNLRDPWGNPYLMQTRKRADGQPYLLFVCIAPDGTLITQFGLGPKAMPKD